MRLFKRLMSNKRVTKKYVRAGAIFGDAVSYLCHGQCVGFEHRLDVWAKWEKEYSFRGFRTVSLDRFTDYGGYGKSIGDVLGQKREEGEELIIHAEIYRSNFLDKPIPHKINSHSDGTFNGKYILPSTEQSVENKQVVIHQPISQ